MRLRPSFSFRSTWDVNGALTLHAHNIIEAMAWVAGLGAKKTPVRRIGLCRGLIAECVGKTLGQLVAPCSPETRRAYGRRRHAGAFASASPQRGLQPA
ncbi:MAG: hypothetical protein ACLRIU_04755 [Adlercreutzia sp.]